MTEPSIEVLLVGPRKSLAVVSRTLSGALLEDKERELRSARQVAEGARNDAVKAGMQSNLVAKEFTELTALLTSVGSPPGLVFRPRPRRSGGLASLARPSIRRRDRAKDQARRRSNRREKRCKELAAVQARADGLAAEREQLTASLAHAEREGAQSATRAEGLEAALQNERNKRSQLEGKGAALTQRVKALLTDKQRTEDKALDVELQLDQALAKVAFMSEQVRAAEARASEGEARFKRDRMRLVEEREDAAVGSQEAWKKMERLALELHAAKAAKASAESRAAKLEQRLGAKAGGE
jgi:hypothetical protein